jgi:hypothetical protein
MTVTKRDLMRALKKADDDAVIYIDNGIDSIECRAVTFIEVHALPENEHVSTDEVGSFLPDGSVVLRLS